MSHLTKRYLKIYLYFWKVSANIAALYRADALMLTLALIMILVTNTTQFSLIFRATPQIAGWSLNEIMFVFGIYNINWGFYKMLYGRTMEDVIDKIFDGQYDYYLLKPMSARFLAYLLPPLFKSIPPTTVSWIFTFVVARTVHLNLSPLNLFLFVFYCAIAHIISISFFQIAISSAFFTGRSDELFGVFENAWEYSKYPGEIFTGNVFSFLTFVVPITLFASYPASILLGKIQFNPYNLLYPIITATVFWLVSDTFYKFGVKNYTSASS